MTKRRFPLLAWDQISQSQVKSACVYLLGRIEGREGCVSPVAISFGRDLCTDGGGHCGISVTSPCCRTGPGDNDSTLSGELEGIKATGGLSVGGLHASVTAETTRRLWAGRLGA